MLTWIPTCVVLSSVMTKFKNSFSQKIATMDGKCPRYNTQKVYKIISILKTNYKPQVLIKFFHGKRWENICKRFKHIPTNVWIKPLVTLEHYIWLHPFTKTIYDLSSCNTLKRTVSSNVTSLTLIYCTAKMNSIQWERWYKPIQQILK